MEWVFFTFRARSFALAYTLFAWSASNTAPPTPALNATIQLILSVTPGWLWRHHPAQYHSGCHLYSVARTAVLAPVKTMPNLVSDSLSRPADVFILT